MVGKHLKAWIWSAAAAAFVCGSAALALEEPPKPASTAAPGTKADAKKDADLPAEIAKQPFEIREGYRKFVKRCTTCHDRKRVDQADKSLFDWQGTIGSMALKKGADIPLDDRQPIFIYLAYLKEMKGPAEQRQQYLTFLTKCEDCHGVGLIYKEQRPMKDWPALIHRMAGKNRAQISPDDEKQAFAYIHRMSPDLFGVEAN